MKKTPIGIVGSGNMATHFMHYLSMENIPYINWSRSKDQLSPIKKLERCKKIFLLISDDSIPKFINEYRDIENRELIHFSGSLTLENILGIHPLMTFSNSLYSLEEYREIPFVGEKGKFTLKELIPDLNNKTYTISKDQKALYHTLCVVGGNFTNIIWQKTFMDFNKELNLPIEILKPYLKQTIKNILNSPFNSLTGPIKREDKKTIKRNIESLKSPIWKKIYKLFNRAYNREIK